MTLPLLRGCTNTCKQKTFFLQKSFHGTERRTFWVIFHRYLMDALWLTVLRRHAKDEKVRRSRSVILVCRRSEGTCESLWGISLGLQTLAKSFSWSNPMLITEAWLWITQPLKLSEKSFTTSLSEWSVTNPWRKHFSVVKRSSSRKGSISLSVRNFIREAWHSWAMERKMFWFLAITWHVFWILFLFCFF